MRFGNDSRCKRARMFNQLFRSSQALGLPKADTSPSTVFWDEFDAGLLQRALNRLEVVRHGNCSPRLEIANSTFPHLRFDRQVDL
jgi:hypothetical protein